MKPQIITWSLEIPDLNFQPLIRRQETLLKSPRNRPQIKTSKYIHILGSRLELACTGCVGAGGESMSFDLIAVSLTCKLIPVPVPWREHENETKMVYSYILSFFGLTCVASAITFYHLQYILFFFFTGIPIDTHVARGIILIFFPLIKKCFFATWIPDTIFFKGNSPRLENKSQLNVTSFMIKKIAHTCSMIFYYDYWNGKYIEIEGPGVIQNYAS